MKPSKLKKIYFILFLTLIAIGEVAAQETTKFFKAEGTPTASDRLYDFEKWNFSTGNNQFEIEKNGKARRTDEKNKITDFHIDLEKAENLVRIYFTRYENDLILICETETWDAGAGFIARFDWMTLKPKWREHIPGFNIAQAVTEENSAYLGAIGFAAKIDLDTGKYIWKHKDFYRKYQEDGAFNIFESPEIKANTIIYTENQDMYKRPPNIIKFNKNSGEVIEVKVN